MTVWQTATEMAGHGVLRSRPDNSPHDVLGPRAKGFRRGIVLGLTMAWVSDVVTGLIVALLVLVAPIRGRIRYERFREEVAGNPSARLRFYWSSLPVRYLLTLVVLALYFANGEDGYGVRFLPTDRSRLVDVLPALAGLVLGAVLIRWRVAHSTRRVRFARAIRGFADLLPRTTTERRVWAVVAISAGITEEALYRAFMMSVIANVLTDADQTTIVVVAAIAFGFAHLYQGVRGVVLTALLGVLLGTVVLQAGLVIAIVIHTLIDLRVLLIPPGVADAAVEVL